MSTGSSELSDDCHFGQGWAGFVDCATNTRVEAGVSSQLSAVRKGDQVTHSFPALMLLHSRPERALLRLAMWNAAVVLRTLSSEH